MDERIECQLRDVCSSIDYGFTASAVNESVGPRFLRITDIVGQALDWHTVPYVSATAKEQSKYALHDGDIVIARTGATTGESAFISDPPPAVFASYLVRLKIRSEVNGRYVAYWLKTRAFKDFMHGVLGEKSAQPNASASTMTSAPFRYPRERAKQDAIVEVLAALDDKIELNRRMNETLEAQARTLFRDWFVDFGPVKAKMAGDSPYLAPDLWSLFPDRLDDDGVPEGWSLKPLDEVADFLNGLALQKFPAKDGEPSLPVIKIAELRTGPTEKSNRASTDLPKKYIIGDGDFIFSWSGSLLAKFWTHGPGALNQHLFKVTSKTYPAWFYSQCVWHHLAEFQMIAASKATTMGHIQRGHLKAAVCVVPPPEALKALSATVEPLVDRTIANELESRTLARVRDLLLPKLMSGEIRVEEVADETELVS